MTYPLIGNYGVNDEDVESRRPWVQRLHRAGGRRRSPSSWRAGCASTSTWRAHGIVGIPGIDTRALDAPPARPRRAGGRHLVRGVGRRARSRERARALPASSGATSSREVTSDQPYAWTRAACWDPARGYVPPRRRRASASSPTTPASSTTSCASSPSIGCEVHGRARRPRPRRTCSSAKPDGVFLSNGPGDPEGVPYLIEAVRELSARVPVFGICLGHQILGLAARGPHVQAAVRPPRRQPSREGPTTGRVEITAQNHGFAVDPASRRAPGLGADAREPQRPDLEGLRHRELPAFSVQYHPEASPGPHDANYSSSASPS